MFSGNSKRASSSNNYCGNNSSNYNADKTFDFDIVSRLASAQKTGLHTDITFTFAECKDEVKAHKLILSLASPVLDAMLYGDSWDANNPVEINDIDPKVFKMMIEFIYTNTMPKYLPIDTAIQLMYSGSKYLVDQLVERIKKYLSDSISLETVLSILNTAMTFNLHQLESKCWECVEMDCDRILYTEEFLSSEIGLVEKILDRDCLTIPEINLFNAILRWAEGQCKRNDIISTPANIKLVLGDVLKKIRFPIIDATDFANGPALSGLLSPEEISNILLTKFTTVANKNPQLYSPKKRISKKQYIRLECQCRKFRIPCTFCLDRDESVVIYKGRKPGSLCSTPNCYCSCRGQDYCPSRRIV